MKKFLAWLILSPLIILSSPFWIFVLLVMGIFKMFDWAADEVSK